MKVMNIIVSGNEDSPMFTTIIPLHYLDEGSLESLLPFLLYAAYFSNSAGEIKNIYGTINIINTILMGKDGMFPHKSQAANYCQS